jgi:hypothetical protein
MKKKVPGSISNPERNERRALRLTAETIRVIDPEAMAGVISGCDTGSYTTEVPPVSKSTC